MAEVLVLVIAVEVMMPFLLFNRDLSNSIKEIIFLQFSLVVDWESAMTPVLALTSEDFAFFWILRIAMMKI